MTSAGGTSVQGALNSTPDTQFRIEIFANSVDDPSGFGEGELFIGATTVTTDPSGNVTFTAAVAPIPAGYFVTATATGPTGDTSEFSGALAASTDFNVVTVTTTADTLDGDTSSISALIANPDGLGNSTGTISLREAITAANSTTNLGGPDEIHFAIPTDDLGHLYYRNDFIAGRLTRANIAMTTATDDSSIADIDPDWQHSWWSIQPTFGSPSQLPFIVEPLTIRGFTQAGAQANSAEIDQPIDAILRIELNGENPLTNPNASGVYVVGPGQSTVEGLVINGFRDGINLSSGGNTVAGNFLGTDVSGTLDVGNRVDGVVFNSTGNTIGGTTTNARNLISGNDNVGIEFGGSGHFVHGNVVGLDASGAKALGNNSRGIHMPGVSNSVIGGTAKEYRNVVSGNGGAGLLSLGISLTVGANGNLIQGNFLGTDITGTLAIGNDSGVNVDSSANNIIGGTLPGAGNLISGNNRGIIILSNSDGNTVQGNWIGTDAAGTGAIPNDSGVDVFISAGTTIGGAAPGAGNLISGNTNSGVSINNTSTGTVVQGNTIVGNGKGVVVGDGSSDNLIGGELPGESNLISGNSGVGVQIAGVGTTGNVLRGNLIGLDSSGATARGNAAEGVVILSSASDNVVGGPGPGAGNVISGNGRAGVRIDGADNNTVLGNLIGTDDSGTAAVGNLVAGVDIGGGSSGNLIGGTDSAARNVISGNGAGAAGVVFFGQAANNEVLGNYIGVDASGLNPLPNLRGVLIETGVDNTIGAPGAGNLISSNTLHGIEILGSGNVISSGNVVSSNQITENGQQGVTIGRGASDNSIVDNSIIGNGANGVSVRTGPIDATGNSILANSIFDNGSLGIDLGENSVTDNDPGDSDTGPNDLQNFPVLTSAGGTSVQGTLNSTPDTQFRIEIFANSVADPSGFGEGELFIGATTVTTDPSGNVAFTAALTSIPGGYFVTATATNLETGDTSEFSIQGTGSVAPEIDVLGNGISIATGDEEPRLADGTDFGSTDVATGSITQEFTIQNNGSADLNLTNLITPVVVGLPDPQDFLVTQPQPGPIASGDSRTFQVTFNPTALGARSARIAIANNDSDEGIYNFVIRGAGLVPEIDVKGNDASIEDGDTTPDLADHTDFGEANRIGETVVRMFTIENTGAADLLLTDPSLVSISGEHADDFSLTLPPATPVANAGGTTTFDITFDPADEGLRTATITIANDDPDETVYDFAIQGTGLRIDNDTDGVDDGLEDAAPNDGDGNDDGTPDSQQTNVASLPNSADGEYLTLVSPDDTTLVDVQAIDDPSAGDLPPDVTFPFGFLAYELEGLEPGDPVQLQLIVYSEEPVESYYKFGREPADDPATPTIDESVEDHWYDFAFDGTTGAEIGDFDPDTGTTTITLNFVDGQRGDHDLTADGVIVDPGAPRLI